MFLVRYWYVMSCLISSPQYFQPTSISPCYPTVANLSHPLVVTSVHFFFTYLNHPSLVSLVLSTTETTPTLFRIAFFLVLSHIVNSHIHLNILISAIIIFWIWSSWLANTQPHLTVKYSFTPNEIIYSHTYLNEIIYSHSYWNFEDISKSIYTVKWNCIVSLCFWCKEIGLDNSDQF